MKTRTQICLCGGILFLLLGCMPKSLAQSVDAEVLNKRIPAVRIYNKSLDLALSEIASKYRVPIGLETALDENELEEERIVVDTSQGTLKELLDSLVQAAPRYQWKVEEGVINVFPRDKQDPLLKAILATSISEVKINPGTSRISVRSAITDLPEIKARMNSASLRPLNLALTSVDHLEAGEGFSLYMKDATLRELLNQIVRTSDVKYWLVSRFGKNNEFLIVNF